MASAPLLPSPIPISTLLNPTQVESQRLEFKATWNDVIAPAVVETACAFANDLYNLNGGYIVLGVEEQEGRPVLPPRGIDDLNLDTVQKKLFGACKAISPDYQPTAFVETYQGRRLLILFCPGGDARPYQAPDSRRKGERGYFVRQGVQTTSANGDTLRQLMEQASKIPWDDRRCLGTDDRRSPASSVLDISPTLVRRYLHTVGSHLAESPLPDEELYRKLRLVLPINAHVEPRNIALLFFHNRPRDFFPGARIEVCEFPEGRGGNKLVEHLFDGPLPEQIERCQTYLEGRLGSVTTKSATGSEARRSVPYPVRALRELLVNAVYHRGYDSPEPIKVYIEPDCIVISSYPGPHPRIQPQDFLPGHTVPETPARNRRIGELLKELSLAEARGSGFLKVHTALAENGSPPLEVDCDPTFFSVRVPIHWESALENADRLFKEGHTYAAQLTIERAHTRHPDSWQLALEGIQFSNRTEARRFADRYLAAAGDKVFAAPLIALVMQLVPGSGWELGRDGMGMSNLLEPLPAPTAHDEVCHYLGRITHFADEHRSIEVARVAYLYWCVNEPGEALLLLDRIDRHWLGIDDRTFVLGLIAGLRLTLAAQLDGEIAEQLLAETLEALESALTLLEDGVGQPHHLLYLRLAQVRQALGMSTRSVATAARLAWAHLDGYGDADVHTLLDRLFPAYRK